MEVPQVYADGIVDPFEHLDNLPEEAIPYRGILYATDRLPGDGAKAYYTKDRGHVIRVGMGQLTLGKENLDWEVLRRASLLKNRPTNYPIRLESVEEMGILEKSTTQFTDPALLAERGSWEVDRFIELINRKLAISRSKKMFIYVHGYKSRFENPLLVTAELWHFMGYDGVALAFTWPATPNPFAYVSDTETAVLSSHNLRILLEFLSEETEVEQINLIGYSAGTRVVIEALHQIALTRSSRDLAQGERSIRLGEVILIGSDYDRDLFGRAMVNGLLEVPQRTTLYLSRSDLALSVTQRLFGEERVGQMFQKRMLPPHVTDYLFSSDTLVLVDVSDAEAAAAGNGHAYLRKSPWVSSDILLSLDGGFAPGERGLVRDPGSAIWSFPEDYIDRITTLLKQELEGYELR